MSIYAAMWDALDPEASGLPKFADMTPEQLASFDGCTRRENEFHRRVALLTLSGMTYEDAYQKAQEPQ